MDIRNAVAVVSGANRGLGRHFAAELLARGAAKVYAGARNPDQVDLPGVTPLQLDITDPESVAAAAAVATDVTLLINNAGKAAEWALTNALRLELAPRGITTTALHVGYMDTDMAAHVDAPKNDPAKIAAMALDALAEGAPEVVADEISRNVRSGLSAELPVLYPQLAG